MSVVFVKYCSLCEHENLAIASFCENCDGDLMNVPVEMRRAEQNRPEPEVRPIAPALTTPPAVELTNPVQRVDENELATRRVAKVSTEAVELELVANPNLRFSVQSGQSVGRSTRADIVLNGVPDLEFISRAHARFLKRRTQWYVQYIAEVNSISVDGVESTDDSEIALYNDSILVLSFTAFRVKLS